MISNFYRQKINPNLTKYLYHWKEHLGTNAWMSYHIHDVHLVTDKLLPKVIDTYCNSPQSLYKDTIACWAVRMGIYCIWSITSEQYHRMYFNVHTNTTKVESCSGQKLWHQWKEVTAPNAIQICRLHVNPVRLPKIRNHGNYACMYIIYPWIV